MNDKTKYARTIIWLGLTGFALIFYATGWYENVSIQEIISGSYYSGFGFLIHWLFTEWMK